MAHFVVVSFFMAAFAASENTAKEDENDDTDNDEVHNCVFILEGRNLVDQIGVTRAKLFETIGCATHEFTKRSGASRKGTFRWTGRGSTRCGVDGYIVVCVGNDTTSFV